jgi:hypothetical protein
MAAVGAQLVVDVARVRADGVHRYEQLVGDLRHAEAGREVAEHAGLGLAERLEEAADPVGSGRCGRLSPGQQVQDRGDQGGMRGPGPALALEQLRRRVDQKREDQPFRAGEIEGALKRAAGGPRVAERVPGDRLEQAGVNRPQAGVRQASGAVDDGGKRDDGRVRIVLGQPERRDGDAHLPVLALRLVHLGQDLFRAPRLAHPDERLQQP